MANTGKWKAGASSVVSQMTTELNSLANGSIALQTTPYDNATNLDLYVEIEVFLSTFTPTTGAYVGIVFVPTLDGINYADSSVNYTQQILVTHAIDSGSSVTRRVVLTNVPLPPCKGKFGLLNGTGAALASSSNTVKISTYNLDLNG